MNVVQVTVEPENRWRCVRWLPTTHGTTLMVIETIEAATKEEALEIFKEVCQVIHRDDDDVNLDDFDCDVYPGIETYWKRNE